MTLPFPSLIMTPQASRFEARIAGPQERAALTEWVESPEAYRWSLVAQSAFSMFGIPVVYDDTTPAGELHLTEDGVVKHRIPIR